MHRIRSPSVRTKKYDHGTVYALHCFFWIQQRWRDSRLEEESPTIPATPRADCKRVLFFYCHNAQVNGAPEDAGIIPRAVVDIFKRVGELRAQGVKASVHASFLEVLTYTRW